MHEPIDAKILERLDQILRVMALQVGADKSITERARLLKSAGMDNRTIAEVLNTSDATIRTLLSNLRSRSKNIKANRSRRR